MLPSFAILCDSTYVLLRTTACKIIDPLPQDEDGDIIEFERLGGFLRSYRRVKTAAQGKDDFWNVARKRLFLLTLAARSSKVPNSRFRPFCQNRNCQKLFSIQDSSGFVHYRSANFSDLPQFQWYGEGALNGGWVPHEIRDDVVDYVRQWSERTNLSSVQMIMWIGVHDGMFYEWWKRYGKVNQHNGWTPRDHWLTDEEKEAILRFYETHPLEGYRRLTYMMLDADIVATSASSV